MTVFQNKNTKKWTFRVYVFDIETNKKKQFTRTGYDTKEQATKEMIDFINLKQNEKTSGITFVKAYENYKKYLKRKLKETTYINLCYNIDKHIYGYFVDIGINYLTDFNSYIVNGFYDYLTKYDCSITHKNKLLNNFLRMLKYFNAMYNISIQYTINLPKFKDDRPKQKNKRTYNDIEMKHFINTANNTTDKIAFNLLYYGALRMGELRGLQWGDIDFDNNCLDINKAVSSKVANGSYKIFSPKTKAGIRTVYIPNELTTLLRQEYDTLQAIENDKVDQLYILGGYNPLGENTIRRAIRETAKKANLPYITPHDFRHSYITNMIISGKVDLKALSVQVGHDSFKTTMDIYTHLNREQQKEKITKALNALNNHNK